MSKTREICEESGFIYLHVHVFMLSHVQHFVMLWTVACQVPLSMEFPRQEYWSGLPFSTPGDLPDPEIKTKCLASPALAGGFFSTAPPGKPCIYLTEWIFVCINGQNAISRQPGLYDAS